MLWRRYAIEVAKSCRSRPRSVNAPLAKRIGFATRGDVDLAEDIDGFADLRRVRRNPAISKSAERRQRRTSDLRATGLRLIR